MTLTGDERSSAPEGDADDAVKEGATHASVIASTPNGQRLRRLLEAIEDFGDDAEAYYEEALAETREHAVGVLFEIARALGNCHDDDYPMRWSLTYAAATIATEKALPLLANIAQTPIPEEDSQDSHSFSTVEEETIIRTTAVDGISELAREGVDGATDVLFELLDSPSFSIRRAAVVGLKESPRGEEWVERIADCLPDEERFLLELKRADVRKVEQISDPTRHLSESGREDAKAEPPVFGGARAPDKDAGKSGPRIAGQAAVKDEDGSDEEKGD